MSTGPRARADRSRGGRTDFAEGESSPLSPRAVCTTWSEAVLVRLRCFVMPRGGASNGEKERRVRERTRRGRRRW